MFIEYNPNPMGKRVGDCVVRAISTATNVEWERAYIDLCDKGLEMKDMPSSNAVWGAYLFDLGFRRYIIPNTCPECYTVRDFCIGNPKGTYILATGSHVISVIDGDYIDTWDSSDETPIYYFRR